MIIRILLGWLFLTGCAQAAAVSPADRAVLNRFWRYASAHRLEELSVNERIPWIALFFLDTPYKSNTLNVTRDELPVVNLRELDCVTFVENVLALAFLEAYRPEAEADFVRNIVRFRYRDGEIVDYTSRLHYSSDWLYEMQRQHLLTDITRFAGGVEYHRRVDFMSKHAASYPQLVQDKKLLEKIRLIETAISQRTYYYIPKDRIDRSYARIKNGDILLITTNIKGLDTSHLGFAYKKEGGTYLLHASSAGKKVMISEWPLKEYMQDIDTQTGIMVGRAARRPQAGFGTGIDCRKRNIKTDR